jgi:release factor glutamine methyltransferase
MHKASSAPLTLADRLTEARGRLIAAGIPADEAAIDVDLYARRILGWDRANLITRRGEQAPAGLDPTFSEWVTRREQREPSAYIIGEREFYGRDFFVSPAVLIPRPETEHIIEALLPLLAAQPAALVADIGTGSGNIAVTLACEAPGCRVVATDVSDIALAVAARNAVRHGVADRVAFVHTSYLDGVTDTFDLIAANPPYVRETDRPGLSLSVQREPAVAIFGGQDGMRDVEGVLGATDARLRRGGWLLMEFGFGQEEDIRQAIARYPVLRLDRVVADLQGLPRTVVAQRR